MFERVVLVFSTPVQQERILAILWSPFRDGSAREKILRFFPIEREFFL